MITYFLNKARLDAQPDKTTTNGAHGAKQELNGN